MHTTESGGAAKPARHDLYCGIHKALRLFMTDTLARVGRLDLGDAAERAETLGQLRRLLNSCRGHVERENGFIHPALEARRPGVSATIGAEHDDHLEAIAALEAETAALAARPEPAAALRLYRRLSRFVAENFEHMLIEETRHNAALWEAYDDAELEALHGRLVASVPAEEMQLLLSWMLAALSPAERAHLQAAPVAEGSLA
ncbi:hemerythrin domain-containing protein [Roseateles violae]|uniref:Hemerythrin domain-containing protein n=1 Tax=Roseateles violae TaxID=3058042 RepID=A0ABT8DSJ0_9BURK|nr:hemerythrin domain-containing protein [Pelomonas sp. PFR6]MDN3921294.1 hemerythrin domain-containing protein [Pelomonas sp. PFR6]